MGASSVDLADQRIYLPDDSRDVEAERRRLEVAERHLRFDEVGMNERGILGALRRTQNDPPRHHARYTAAIAVLARMEDRVSPRACQSELPTSRLRRRTTSPSLKWSTVRRNPMTAERDSARARK